MSESTFESSADRPAFDHQAQLRQARLRAGKSRQRSAITNGSKLLAGVDGRSPWIRRCRDIIAAHLSDVGGEGNASAAERSLIRRASVITTELEFLEARFATAGDGAKPDDLDLYFRGSNNLRRLLESLGLKRRPKVVVPSVTAYLDHLNQVAPKPALEVPGELTGEVLGPGWEDTP